MVDPGESEKYNEQEQANTPYSPSFHPIDL